ncbi:peptidoglycan binding domain-containing protein [Calothrix brevissima NIES-22]|nr:peptidoglycan binding domain-containing protein [Calothrix brevissima NIES-22]
MNWKLLALIPVISLATALPSHAVMTKKNQVANNNKVTQTSQQAVVAKKTTVAVAKKPTHANQVIALRQGSQGTTVKTAQEFLKKEGLYNGNANGVFDKQTRLAVIKFQKSKGLKADGIIGHRTLAAMK